MGLLYINHLVQEICRARATSRDPGVWATTRAGAAAVADRVLTRLAAGTSRLPACPITGLPFATDPPRDGGSACHAVQLHQCGCIMSKCVADATLDAGTCAVCRAALPVGEGYRLSHAMLCVAQAHRARMLPAEVAPEYLTVEPAPFPVPLGARADGTFRAGMLRDTPVAVLQLHLGSTEDVTPAQRACISHAIVATNLAATLSPLHSRLLGVVWEADHVSVAYDREAFQGDPGSELKPAGPVTVADVIATSCSGRPAQQALDVVIDVAEAHAVAKAAVWSDSTLPALGALTPDRLLVRPDRRIQVVDFRLLSRSCVPPAVASAVRDCTPPGQTPVAQSPHTERYLAPEAEDGDAVSPRNTDAPIVFSLGALLHFLVAGRHPPTMAELDELRRKAPWAGSTRALTQSITRANLSANAPPSTDEMRARMIDRVPDVRPMLIEVTDALMRERTALTGTEPVQNAEAQAADSAVGTAAPVVPAWDRAPSPSTTCSPSRVFRLPERAEYVPPPTYSLGMSVAGGPSVQSATAASAQAEATGLPQTVRNVFTIPATAGVTKDLHPTALRHNNTLHAHTEGSQSSTMSTSGGVAAAVGPEGPTAGSWAMAEPLQSCSTSCGGSDPMAATRAPSAGPDDVRSGDAAGRRPGDLAARQSVDAIGGGPERPPATDRTSSAGMGVDGASQMSNGSADRHEACSPQLPHKQKSIGLPRKTLSSWFSKVRLCCAVLGVKYASGVWRQGARAHPDARSCDALGHAADGMLDGLHTQSVPRCSERAVRLQGTPNRMFRSDAAALQMSPILEAPVATAAAIENVMPRCPDPALP